MLELLANINSSKDIIFIIIRAIIICIYAIFLIRLGNRRYHFETAFDFILIIIIGSILSRAVNGSSSLLAGITGSIVIVFFHWIFALGSFYSHLFGKFIKGESDLLIKEGKIIWELLRGNQITEKDLQELCRLRLNHNNLQLIQEARLERSRTISFLTNKKNKE